MAQLEFVGTVELREDTLKGAQVGDGMVSFTIQSIGGGVDMGDELPIYDHRQNTVRAIWEGVDQLREAVTKPARIVVGDYCIDLFSTEEQSATLLSETVYIQKHNARFDLVEDKSFWSWESWSSSRTGRHCEMVLVAVTDEQHYVLIEIDGYENVGHTNYDLAVIGGTARKINEAASYG